MKTLSTLSLISLLFIFACNLRDGIHDPIGKKQLTCLYEASEKQDLDLKTELFKYEAQLIDIKTLKDSSIASYTHIFETVAQNGAFPFPKKFEYSAKGLTPEVLHQLNEDCREGRSLGFINSLANRNQ